MKIGHGFLTFFEFLRNMWLILAESVIFSDLAFTNRAMPKFIEA